MDLQAVDVGNCDGGREFRKNLFSIINDRMEKIRKFGTNGLPPEVDTRGEERRGGGTVLMGRLSCNLRRIFILFRGFWFSFILFIFVVIGRIMMENGAVR